MAVGEAAGAGVNKYGLTPRQRYELIFNTLKTARAQFDPIYVELAEQFLPARPRFAINQRNQATNARFTQVYDSEPIFAARTLQHGFHSGITSPARPWFKLTTPDPDLAEFQSVKEWLHKVTERMQTVFLRSNLYNVLPTLYADLGVFATAAMGWLEDRDSLLRGYSYPIGSYVLGLDHRGRVGTFCREFQLSVRQVVEMFGPTDPYQRPRDVDWSRFSDQVKDAWQRGEYEQPVDIIWYVAPNDDYDAARLEAKYSLPWKSCYFEYGRADEAYARSNGRMTFLRESGFRSLPVFAPRWDVTGEDSYGTSSPGLIARGDARQLQMMTKRSAQLVEKAVNPPVKASNAVMNTKVSMVPGGITWVDDPTGKLVAPLHEVRLEGLQFLELGMDKTRTRIDRAFYADLFLMLQHADALGADQQKTAREILERHEEKLLALGPVLERLNDELLDPLIDRTFETMLEAGLVPPAPEELQGVDLKVEYLSVMAAAQKLTGAGALDRFLQTAMLAAEKVFPDARHKVNVLELMDEYALVLGVPPRVVRTDEEAEALAAAEAQAMQAAQDAAAMKDSATAMHAMAQSPVQTNGGGASALDAYLASQQQA